MNIYIMRHGEAELDAEEDSLRALTKLGERQSLQVAQWLTARINRLDRVLVSPYVRAKQTWQAISSLLPPAKVVEVEEELIPYGDAAKVADYLRALDMGDPEQTVLIISHLPVVGYMVNELCPAIAPPLFVTSGLASLKLNQGQGALEELLGPHDLVKM